MVQGLKWVPKWVQPAIGGAATGAFAVVAILFFHVNGIAGNPYTTLTQALARQSASHGDGGAVRLKLAATVTSYSSGGSGGIFAPALYMGGMLGGAVGYLDVTVFHHPADSIGAFAVVGMGAVFAGIVRAPMTSVLIIFEMTGGYGLILPLMIANMSAFALARHWRHTPVYEALLEQDGIFLDRKHRPHDSSGPAAAAEELHAAEEPFTPGMRANFRDWRVESRRPQERLRYSNSGIALGARRISSSVDPATAAPCCKGSRRAVPGKDRGNPWGRGG